jgi:hypothetical protein
MHDWRTGISVRLRDRETQSVVRERNPGLLDETNNTYSNACAVRVDEGGQYLVDIQVPAGFRWKGPDVLAIMISTYENAFSNIMLSKPEDSGIVATTSSPVFPADSSFW